MADINKRIITGLGIPRNEWDEYLKLHLQLRLDSGLPDEELFSEEEKDLLCKVINDYRKKDRKVCALLVHLICHLNVHKE